MYVGKIIKDNRTKRSMTQEELGQELFVSRQLVSKWENGRSYPDLEQLIQLSDFFNISLDELMRGDTKMTKKLNFNVKKRTLFYWLFAGLVLIIIGGGYYIWSDQMVSVAPKDIIVEKIEIKQVKEKKVFDEATKKMVTLPKDVDYKIHIKTNKPFYKFRLVYPDSGIIKDSENLYVIVMGQRTLLPSKKNQSTVVYIPSSNTVIDKTVEEGISTRRNKGKDIRMVNNTKEDLENPKSKSWLLVDKKEEK